MKNQIRIFQFNKGAFTVRTKGIRAYRKTPHKLPGETLESRGGCNPPKGPGENIIQKMFYPRRISENAFSKLFFRGGDFNFYLFIN